MNELINEIYKVIEDNKIKYNIDYIDSIETLKELIKEIENEYKELENE